MNALFSLLGVFAAAAVSALPVTFNSRLLKEGDFNLSVLSHATHEVGDDALRFLHLVPKMNTYMKDGFESQDDEAGSPPVHHNFLDVVDHDAGEKFVSLAGFSDCSSWHAGVVTVVGPAGLVHKGFTAVLQDEDDVFKLTWHAGEGVLADVAEFVHKKTTLELFMGVVRDGLASHHLSHLLYAKFKKDLDSEL